MKYTIRLTRGMYVVNAEDADRVLAGIEAKAVHVLVSADTMGDGLYTCPVRIILAHVMAIVENQPPEDESKQTRKGRLRAVTDFAAPDAID